MPVTLVRSRWDSGNLIFHESTSLATIADILKLETTMVTVGSATNDIDFKVFLGSAAKYAEFNCGDSAINLVDVGIVATKSTGATANSNGIYETLTIDGIVSNSVSGIRCLVNTDATARTPVNIFGGNFAVRLANTGDRVTGILAGLQVGVDMGLATGAQMWAYGINIDLTEIATRATAPKAFVDFQDYDSGGSYPCISLFDIGGGGSRASSGDKAAKKLVSTADVTGGGAAAGGGIQIIVNGTAYWLATYSI